MTLEEEHRARPWKVHALAADFQLLDAWRIPIEADPARGESFDQFLRVFLENGVRTDSRAADALFRLRAFLGRAFKLDEQRSVPGTQEGSVAERLSPEDGWADRSGEFSMPVPLQPVYVFDDEALMEISNKTIHALLHLGWVDGAPGKKTVAMAVYIKSRGWLSRGYMALIAPFRHRVVYPPWIRRICRQWEAARSS